MQKEKNISNPPDNGQRAQKKQIILQMLFKKCCETLFRQGPGMLLKKMFIYMKGSDAVRFSLRRLAFTPRSTRSGINIVGYLGKETGLGESVRTLVQSVKTTGIEHFLINYDTQPLKDRDIRYEKEYRLSNPGHVNVIVINPDGLDPALAYLGKNFVSGRYNIAYWAWELPDIPPEWKKYEEYFDEFWVPSEFVRNALLKTIDKPVQVIPHSIEVQSFNHYRRRHFGCFRDAFVFSFIFDYHSLFERKNPVAVVRSFKKAFQGNENVQLVVKCSDPAGFQQQHDLLLKEIGADGRIKIISRRLTRDEIYSLLAVSDAYVSLHRSEGFGLTIAEAMFLGKPVICTGYSGNLDFAKENNSFLVGYRKLRLEKDIGPYRQGDEWVDADVDEAAHYMREIYYKEDVRETAGRQGQAYVQDYLNPISIGKMIKKRFEQIQLKGEGRPISEARD